MPRVNCAFCGLPFSVRNVSEGAQHFCCSGCALASRIPMNGDVLPVSRGLVIALALGFGLFNQILFSVLGQAIVAQGRLDVGGRMVGIGVAVGIVLLLVNVTFLVTARPRRWSDGAAGLLAIMLAAWAIIRGVQGGGWIGVAGPLLGANVALALWWSRGWLRRFIGRRKTPA